MENFLKSNPTWSKEQEVTLNSEPNLLVLGCAGSGKTLLAAHIAVKRHQEFGENILIIVFTKSLSAYIKDLISKIDISANINVEHAYKGKHFKNYDVVIVDEIFDFSNPEIEYFISLAANGVYLFGDEKQILSSIDKSFKPVCIERIAAYTKLTTIKLSKTYRIPRQSSEFIRRAISNKGLTTNNAINDQLPFIKYCETLDQEIEWLSEHILSLRKENKYHNIAVLLPQNNRSISHSSMMTEKYPYFPGINDVVSILNEHQIHAGYKDRTVENLDFISTFRVNVLTIHSSKGLEFDYVIIPFSDPLNYYPDRGGNLIYVAFTRTSGGLAISYSKGITDMIESKKIPQSYYTGEIVKLQNTMFEQEKINEEVRNSAYEQEMKRIGDDTTLSREEKKQAIINCFNKINDSTIL